MTQLTFDQFIHPLSEFPHGINSHNADEPMLDLYTMAGLILYTACANNNFNATNYTFSTSAVNLGIKDVQLLFERCKVGDRSAILQITNLIVTGLQTRLENRGLEKSSCL